MREIREKESVRERTKRRREVRKRGGRREEKYHQVGTNETDDFVRRKKQERKHIFQSPRNIAAAKEKKSF